MNRDWPRRFRGAQVTGQARSVIYPESKTQFFYKYKEVQITFNVDESGKVVSLRLRRDGKNSIGKRVGEGL